MGVVIGPQTDGGEAEFRRVPVEDFLPDDETWNMLVVDSADGKEERIRAITRYGFRGNASKFCWERPYRYFEDWMRHSCPPVAFWDSKTFAEQFFGLLKLKSDWRVYSQFGSNQTDCFAMAAYHDLIPGVAYGGIEKTMDDGYQFILWPAFALDFGAWMMTRPDLKDLRNSAWRVHNSNLEDVAFFMVSRRKPPPNPTSPSISRSSLHPATVPRGF
ncbi:hypothetical protein DFH06DRAFT_1148008 [Mycena polygramma]|nr:hypothetical protein DFH06DRAFT_1148008 [Mycena polygramma]